MTTATAPGKMIILGEYAVLEGADALVYAVNRKAHVTAQTVPGNEFKVYSPSLNVPTQPFILTPQLKVRFDPNLASNFKNKLLFFKKIFEHLVLGFPGFTNNTGLSIELVTDDFYLKQLHSKLGFGSSAALTIALAKAVSSELQIDMNDTQLFRLALQAHREAQGSLGSGIDIAASYYGGVSKYTMNVPGTAEQQIPKPLKHWDNLPLAVVWSGRSASTSRMVQSVSGLRQGNPKLYTSLIKDLKQISFSGIQAYEAQELAEFLQQIRQFYSAMKRLGNESGTPIISDTHKKLAQLVETNGGAYKPSGAGGGDIGLVFASTSEQLTEIKKRIVDQKFKIIDTELSTQGVTID